MYVCDIYNWTVRPTLDVLILQIIQNSSRVKYLVIYEYDVRSITVMQVYSFSKSL